MSGEKAKKWELRTRLADGTVIVLYCLITPSKGSQRVSRKGEMHGCSGLVSENA